MDFICECGKTFISSRSFNGHKSHCKVHAAATGNLEELLKTESRRHKNALKTIEYKKKY